MKNDERSISYYGVRVPAEDTLKKHGLDIEWWRREVAALKGRCPICGEKKDRLVIDHLHIRGWKMLPRPERRPYVRGLACITCNHFILTRYATPQKLRNAADFLEARDPRWRRAEVVD